MNVNEVRESYEAVQAYRKVAKAIEFKEAYKAQTGHRPSLVSVIAMAQAYEARALAAEAKLAEAEQDLEQAEQDLSDERSE